MQHWKSRAMVVVIQLIDFILMRHEKKTHSPAAWYSFIVSFQDGKRSADNLTRQGFILSVERKKGTKRRRFE